MTPERLSVEVTNRCSKACAFCYNRSGPDGGGDWEPEALLRFVRECAARGTKAVSFGGGEPLEWPPLMDVLARLGGVLFRSITTNGLPLDDCAVDQLARARPDKVHVSIHDPGREAEVRRVVGQVAALEARGIRAGVNLLVRRSTVGEARVAAQALFDAGIGTERIIFLPMRGADTPEPRDIGQVAGGRRFQSTSCLAACGPSPRFCSIRWDRTVAWCSYTSERRRLEEATAAALEKALEGLGVAWCGGAA